MDHEFQDFFEFLEKVTDSNEKAMRKVLRPLRYYLYKQQLKRFLKFAIVVIAICFAIYHIDSLNWYFCAIGRIFLIKLLPVWNWKYLGNAKCLIAKAQVSSSLSSIESNMLDKKDCRACEYFEQIEITKEKLPYSYHYDKFLIRGLPVIIVSDTLKIRRDAEEESLLSFIDNISANMSDMIHSEPCNFETNLMMSKYANLDKAFSILRKSLEASSDNIAPWFISFRNCKMKALKASRLLMPKPYFYPINLQAPYTTWLLLSQKYENYRNTLEVYGLIIVTQMRGNVKINLRVNERCENMCKDLSVMLFAGESLMFFSNLWTLSYEYLADSNYSVTYVTETHLY